MPRYDYRCRECRHTFTLTFATYRLVDESTPACPRCGSLSLSRLIRRVALMTGEETRLERLSDPARLAGIDEDDPRAMARFMREMAGEIGEDSGPEFNEVVERLEAGESMESIENSLPPPDAPASAGQDI